MGQQLNQIVVDRINSDELHLDVSTRNAGLYYLQVTIDGELREVVKVMIE